MQGATDSAYVWRSPFYELFGHVSVVQTSVQHFVEIWKEVQESFDEFQVVHQVEAFMAVGIQFIIINAFDF